MKNPRTTRLEASHLANHWVGDGDFAKIYCETYGCRAGDFENDLLRRCLHPVSKPVAWCVWMLNPVFFQTDFDLISEIRYATSYAQVRDLVNYYCATLPHADYPRQWLKLRMSKGRLLAIAKPLFYRQELFRPSAVSGLQAIHTLG